MADCRHYCLFLLLLLLLLFIFMKMKNIYNIFLFSLPPTFTSNIELVMHFELTMKRGQIKPKFW